jgi:energy-coupling factor transporter ATP-binding protein EcfA2
LNGHLWLDRERELAALREAARSGRSLLISGPAGAGKSALVEHALSVLKPAASRRFLRAGGPAGLRDLLRKLIAELRAARDATLAAELRSAGVRAEGFSRWLGAQSSSRLKGAVYRSADAARLAVVVDHAPALTAAEAKVLVELVRMRRTPVWFITRHSDGRVAQLLAEIYWDRSSRLVLGPLPPAAARELLDAAIRSNRLERFDLADFRPEVLRLSRRLPGAILGLCRLASDAGYRSGNRIKTRVAYVDYETAGRWHKG